LNINRTQTLVYLNPGDSSYIEFDVTAPIDGPKFSAISKKLTPIFSRATSLKDFMSNWRELYSLTADDFNKEIDSLQSVVNAHIDSLKGETKSIVEMEKQRANYAFLNIRYNYPEYFAYLNGKEFNPDSADYSFLNQVDLNRADH
jgi:hypothetical protein